MTLEQIIDELHTRRNDLEIRAADEDSEGLWAELDTVTAMLDLYYNINS